MVRNFCVLSMTLAAVLSCTACRTRMTGIAPSSTPITAKDSYTEIGPTYGRAYNISVLGILQLSTPNPSGVALGRAIRNMKADALIEVTQDYTKYYLPVINLSVTTVRGTAVKIQRGGAIE